MNKIYPAWLSEYGRERWLFAAVDLIDRGVLESVYVYYDDEISVEPYPEVLELDFKGEER